MAFATRSEVPAEGPVEVTTPTTPVASRTSRLIGLAIAALAVFAIGSGVAARFSRERHAAAARSTDLRVRRAAADLPPEVAVATPVAFAYSPHFSITGTLDPVQEADLGFNASGRVARAATRHTKSTADEPVFMDGRTPRYNPKLGPLLYISRGQLSSGTSTSAAAAM